MTCEMDIGAIREMGYRRVSNQLVPWVHAAKPLRVMPVCPRGRAFVRPRDDGKSRVCIPGHDHSHAFPSPSRSRSYGSEPVTRTGPVYRAQDRPTCRRTRGAECADAGHPQSDRRPHRPRISGHVCRRCADEDQDHALKRAEHVVLVDRRPRHQPKRIPRSRRKKK